MPIVSASPVSDGDKDLHQRLGRWVAASLISEAEASAIERYEAEHPARAPHASLVVEALAYLGGALATAATVVVLSRSWDEMAPGAHVGILGGIAAIALVAGAVLRGSSEPAIDRLVGVLWAASAGFAGVAAGVAASELGDVGDRGSLAIAGGTVAATALVTYGLHRRMLEQAGVLVGLLIALFQAVGPNADEAHGAIWAGVGVAWIALGWREILTPRRPALVFGSIAALIGAMSATGGQTAIGLTLGLGVAIALIVASVALREAVMLALGVIGLFQASVQTISRYFSGTIAMPVALIAAGGVAFLAALVLARRGRGAHGPGTTGG